MEYCVQQSTTNSPFPKKGARGARAIERPDYGRSDPRHQASWELLTKQMLGPEPHGSQVKALIMIGDLDCYFGPL